MSEREEYTAENYPSFGKKYNGEKAIISLTSWKARINTVSKTLFSLLKQCPDFHIVLVLSEEEFPKMMDELPDELKLFTDNEMIEILWVYKNYKSFKKVLFTMDKYRTVPVISADDDCIYTCNYAQELYDRSKQINEKIITFARSGCGQYFTQGPCTFYKTNMLNDYLNDCFNEMNKRTDFSQDDSYYHQFLLKRKILVGWVHNDRFHLPYKFHTTIGAINPSQYSNPWARIALNWGI